MAYQNKTRRYRLLSDLPSGFYGTIVGPDTTNAQIPDGGVCMVEIDVADQVIGIPFGRTRAAFEAEFEEETP